jgi:hypothetical protein
MYYGRAALLCVFWGAKGLDVKDIRKEMFHIYCGMCLSRKAVHKLGQEIL